MFKNTPLKKNYKKNNSKQQQKPYGWSVSLRCCLFLLMKINKKNSISKVKSLSFIKLNLFTC